MLIFDTHYYLREFLSSITASVNIFMIHVSFYCAPISSIHLLILSVIALAVCELLFTYPKAAMNILWIRTCVAAFLLPSWIWFSIKESARDYETHVNLHEIIFGGFKEVYSWKVQTQYKKIEWKRKLKLAKWKTFSFMNIFSHSSPGWTLTRNDFFRHLQNGQFHDQLIINELIRLLAI